MNVLALRHVPFEDLGTLEGLLRNRGARITQLDAPLVDFAALNPLAPALVIILGGPIGANDEDAYPFLSEELRLLERRLEANLPTLGICLGSQLIARALGARVYAGERKEIGWGPIALSSDGQTSPLSHFKSADVLHWHGDTFEIPAGATRLASSSLYENQAFALGRTLALQFHVEVARLEPWLVGHAVELRDAGVDVGVLRKAAFRQAPAMSAAAGAMLEQWLSEVGL